MENRFCFVAIVRDEEPIISRCLRSIENLATSYLICDTGSDDNTIELIEKTMAGKQIPGEVLHNQWKNFGYNKSWLLDQAFTHKKSGGAKYLVWHDADEVFLTDPTNPESYVTKADADSLFNWLEKQSEPITYITTYYGNLVYRRWNIVRNNQLYEWISPVQEWLSATVDNRSNFYDKIILLARKQGNSSRNPNRTKDDIQMLLGYIEEKGGNEKCAREIFYLAESYESVDIEKAIEYNKIRVGLTTGWDQEKYISYDRLGRLCEKKADKIKWWYEGHKLCPTRLECIHRIMKYFFDKGKHSKGLQWAALATENREISTTDLFVDRELYESLFDLNYSLVAYHAGKYQLAHDINQRNIKRNMSNPKCKHMALLLSNNVFYEKALNTNKNLIKLSSIQPQTASVIALSSDAQRFSTDIRPSIIIVDDFYPDPDNMRQQALNADFSIRGNFPGVRTPSFATDELKKRFETIIGKKITYWPSQYNGSFQYTTADQKSWIHRDCTDYSAIIYMSPNAPANSGTVTYRHLKTNTQFATNLIIGQILDADSNNYAAWEQMDVIGNKYNRCILFNGKCSHKSNEYFGTDKVSGRLFQTFFFDTEH